MQSETSATALPNPDHVGIVVKDTDKTVEFLSSIGVGGPWKTLYYDQDKDTLLAGEPFRLKVAFAKVGTIVFELIQPVEGNSIWAQFLKTNGEGVQHVAFSVANFDEWVSRVQSQGGRMITGGRALVKEAEDGITAVGSPEGNRWCYLDTKPGGMIIEFMDNLFGLASAF